MRSIIDQASLKFRITAEQVGLQRHGAPQCDHRTSWLARKSSELLGSIERARGVAS
jgi:hypothetical protein